jgi:hypothetical protein
MNASYLDTYVVNATENENVTQTDKIYTDKIEYMLLRLDTESGADADCAPEHRTCRCDAECEARDDCCLDCAPVTEAHGCNWHDLVKRKFEQCTETWIIDAHGNGRGNEIGSTPVEVLNKTRYHEIAGMFLRNGSQITAITVGSVMNATADSGFRDYVIEYAFNHNLTAGLYVKDMTEGGNRTYGHALVAGVKPCWHESEFFNDSAKHNLTAQEVVGYHLEETRRTNATRL